MKEAMKAALLVRYTHLERQFGRKFKMSDQMFPAYGHDLVKGDEYQGLTPQN